MPNISKYIAEKVCELLEEEIALANGNEVFFVGWVDDDLRVHDAQVVARGNQGAVPAIMKLAQEADVVIHNHPSGELRPSDADLNIAARLDAFSVAFYIVNNMADDVYVVVEPFTKGETKLLGTTEIEKLLLPGGPVSQALPGYEDRPQQIEMIDAIVQAFNNKKIATDRKSVV